MIKVAIYHI